MTSHVTLNGSPVTRQEKPLKTQLTDTMVFRTGLHHGAPSGAAPSQNGLLKRKQEEKLEATKQPRNKAGVRNLGFL